MPDTRNLVLFDDGPLRGVEMKTWATPDLVTMRTSDGAYHTYEATASRPIVYGHPNYGLEVRMALAAGPGSP